MLIGYRSHNNYFHSLWDSEVQCRIHNRPPIIPILNGTNPIPRFDSNFFKTHFNIILSLPRGLFPVWLSIKIFKVLLLSSTLNTCPAHLNLPNIITLIKENGTNCEALLCLGLKSKSFNLLKVFVSNFFVVPFRNYLNFYSRILSLHNFQNLIRNFSTL